MSPAGGEGGPPPLRRPRYTAPAAAAVIASPLFALLLFDLGALLQAVLDPASTCWLKPLAEAGQRRLYPFEIHLLFFTATLRFWAPLVILAVVLFWYLDWIRVRDLVWVALLYAAGLYLLGVEYGWMVELYRGRYQAGCG